MPETNLSPRPRVLWYSQQTSFDLSKQTPIDFFFCNQLGSYDAYVLPFDQFNSVDELAQFHAQCERPTLLMVDNESIESALTILREFDDLCMLESPRRIIEMRVKGLLFTWRQMVDPLTMVMRRDYLLDRLQKLSSSAHPDAPVSFTTFDIDYFKSINDQFGHHVGDVVLVRLGELLSEFYPRQNIGRIMGGKFGAISFTDEHTAYGVAEQIRLAFATHKFEPALDATVSAGVATVIGPVSNHAFANMSDEALISAKAKGRDTAQTYSQIREDSLRAGDDVDIMLFENQARVLTERVTNFITQRSKKLLRKLRSEAETDGLTQVFTRRYFDRRLQNDFDRALMHDKQLCLALVDLDYFGQVNKQYGWPTGDKTLTDVCDLIQEHLRASDWVGRYGGEEICIVLPNTNLQDSGKIAERIRQAVAEHRFTATTGETFGVTLSVGLVEMNNLLDSCPAELIERVSQKTLSAKQAGRNQVAM